jgi:hypothetical protein
VTSSEWADAFRRGDPDAIGMVLLSTFRQAHREQVAKLDNAATDVGELKSDTDRPNHVRQLMTRTGEILRELGVTVPGDSLEQSNHVHQLIEQYSQEAESSIARVADHMDAGNTVGAATANGEAETLERVVDDLRKLTR